AQRDLLFGAALRAPDHGQLRPWRFITVEGAAREQLGELLVSALRASQPQAGAEALAKARAMPLRAPLVVLVIARLQAHFKVPAQEQLLAAGCAAHGLLLAAHAIGVGAVWRTGELAYSPEVAAGLGLRADEQLIAMLYLGTPQGELRTPVRLSPEDFVSVWPG
ncbi:MAG: nitroreductase, partial [Pseudomonadaceae bacterium]|nr:nitroreductase [Pseudomonadaceae bacterium]